jgi:hypothetical protein
MNIISRPRNKTYFKQLPQLQGRNIGIQALAQTLDVVEIQDLVALFVRAFPVLSLPDRLTHFSVPEAGHQPLSDSVQLLQPCRPFLKDIARQRHDMQCLVFALENVDDRDPPFFILLWKLELATVVARVRADPQLFDALDGDWSGRSTALAEPPRG